MTKTSVIIPYYEYCWQQGSKNREKVSDKKIEISGRNLIHITIYSAKASDINQNIHHTDI